ncbi:MAG: pyridoxamine 5'-phosphate oxidase family protein [Myxococcota bacterium]
MKAELESENAQALACDAPLDSLRAAWPSIRALWKRCRYVPIASVDEAGNPHISPIGSVWLHPTEPRGVFLQLYTQRLPRNLDGQPRFTALLVDNGAMFWLSSLIRGSFSRPVGVRLHGVAGPRREPTPQEQERFLRVVRPVSWTKGHDLLWKDKRFFTRDLTFDGATPVRIGAMTKASQIRV